MLETDMRIAYIKDYIAKNTVKIQMSNPAGLFDNAKLYELFAQEVCCIWFGQKFKNLNLVKQGYPYVDLVSEDGKVYIQCSTQENIAGKIKTTLQGIAESKDPIVKAIEELFFFVLEPGGKRIPDYSGNNRIGKISFDPNNNLITPSALIKRASTDFEFQRKLYELSQKDSMQVEALEAQFQEALNRSRIQVDSIDGLIDGQYPIERKGLIEKIRKNTEQFVMVEGAPGVGKTTLCKMLVQREDQYLYARADELAACRSLRSVWGIDIDRTLQLCSDRKVYFFIDALEFLTDGIPGGRTTLIQLCEVVNKHNNAYLIMSCRSSEIDTMADIIGRFNIAEYQVEELTPTEVFLIGERFPVIKTLMDVDAYRQILPNPFYTNLIVSKLKDAITITDENELRRSIWRDVICLGADIPDNIASTAIIEAVRKITFERARQFSPGISEDIVDRKVLNLLISEGIVSSTEHRVRLKYDIFEDICFEIQFDEFFENCGGNYREFFSRIEEYGGCAYRRYQIWVENKLFGKHNRDRFISKILFDGSVSTAWQEQTLIGIIRSRYSGDFVQEYAQQLYTTGMYVQLLRMLNLHAYQIEIRMLTNGDPYTVAKPVGQIRGSMIRFAKQYGITEKPELVPQICELINDYGSQDRGREQETSEIAAEILLKYISHQWSKVCGYKYREDDESIMKYVRPLYTFAEYVPAKISAFWDSVTGAYLEDDRSRKHDMAERILEKTILSPPQQLTRYMPKRLCELANVYWLEIPKKRELHTWGYFPETSDFSNLFRLNHNARRYAQKIRSPEQSVLIQQLLWEHFWIGLDWGISLINTIVAQYVQYEKNGISDIAIQLRNEDRKHYYGSSDFWFVCTDNSTVPKLISDFIFLLTKQSSHLLSSDELASEQKRHFAERLKSFLYAKSNSIIPLRVIADLGIMFPDLLPGYAVELVSDPWITFMDTQLYVNSHPSETIKRINDDVHTILGIPQLKPRYQPLRNGMLRDYIVMQQLVGEAELVQTIQEKLDRLYQGIETSEEDDSFRIMIRNMDLRCYGVEHNKDELVLVPNSLKGDTDQIMSDNMDSQNSEERKLAQLLSNISQSYQCGDLSLSVCLESLTRLRSDFHEEELKPDIVRTTILVTSMTLSLPDLDSENRSDMCDYWIEGISDIYNNRVFTFDRKLCHVLFQQNEQPLRDQTAKSLRYLILRLLIERNQNGLLDEIADILTGYLKQNSILANNVFAAIVALSKRSDLRPLTPDCPEETVQAYLAGEMLTDAVNLSFEDCHCGILSCALRCGLSLQHPRFKEMVRCVLHELLRSCKQPAKGYSDDYWDMQSNIKHYFISQFQKMEECADFADLLFEDSSIQLFTIQSAEFYVDVFAYISCVYFDAYNTPEDRQKCEELIGILERAIHRVQDQEIRHHLIRILFLTPWTISLADIQRLRTKYTYHDKEFLNQLWIKYGARHVSDFLQVIYQMKISELLPEVLLAVAAVFKSAGNDQGRFTVALRENDYFINSVITKAEFEHRDQIKQDQELRQAYETILGVLIQYGYRAAAVLMNDFRTH